MMEGIIISVFVIGIIIGWWIGVSTQENKNTEFFNLQMEHRLAISQENTRQNKEVHRLQRSIISLGEELDKYIKDPYERHRIINKARFPENY